MRSKDSVKKLREIYRKEKLYLKEVRRKNKFQSFNTVHAKERRNEIDMDINLIKKLKDGVFKQFLHFIPPGTNERRYFLSPEVCHYWYEQLELRA